MSKNRLFVAQSTLDRWLEESRVSVDGEVMTTSPEAHEFTLKTAVLFREEVTGAGDAAGLLGRVKDLEQIAALGGDYSSGSVILGDVAYEVLEGFVGEPIIPEADDVATGDSLADAMRSAAGDTSRSGEIDLLARLFLSTRQG